MTRNNGNDGTATVIGGSETARSNVKRIARVHGTRPYTIIHMKRTLLARCVGLALIDAGLLGQSGAKNGEWPTYGGDLGHTRYSPLDQINAGNFSKLEVAWRFKTDSLGPRPEFKLESTPLMVDGRLFSTGGTRRAVVALDAATGELLWMHSEHEGARGAGGAAAAVGPRPLRTGPTARRSGSSTSRPATGSSRSTRKTGQPVARLRPRTASSI